jgi:hypothetical protein
MIAGLLTVALVPTIAARAQTRHATPAEKKPPQRDSYVGDAACKPCHEEEFKTY